MSTNSYPEPPPPLALQQQQPPRTSPAPQILWQQNAVPAAAEQPPSSGEKGQRHSKNYVNFNQFIQQHNFGAASSGDPTANFANASPSTNNNGGGGGGGMSFGATTTTASNKNHNNNIYGPGTAGGVGGNAVFFDFVQSSGGGGASTGVADSYQMNYFNPNSNLFPSSNGGGDVATLAPPLLPGVYANGGTTTAASGAAVAATGANAYFENAFSPTYVYSNPFAHGLDVKYSKLNANSPEFLPRFNQLSIGETNGGTTGGAPPPAHLNGKNENGKYANIFANEVGVQSSTFTRTTENAQTAVMTSSSSASSTSPPPGEGGTGAIARGPPGKGKNATRSGARNTNGTYNGGHQNGYNDKYAAARAERERERDRRRYRNGHDTNATAAGAPAPAHEENYQRFSPNERYNSKERFGRSNNGNFEAYNEGAHERYDRETNGGGGGRDGGGGGNYNERYEREERSERGARRERGTGLGYRGNRERDRENHQRFDNYRSNKRRDDWNRNRDRINGFRMEEKFALDNNKDSPIPSPEKKLSPKKAYPENEKLSQREKLIRDIETRRLECLVCVEPIKVHQPVWSCHNCYLILHLQCVTKWASSSRSDDGWRCPACQNVVKEVPREYYCFCGKVKNPPLNRQDIAHSCGEVCGRIEGCSHACTLLCHPGPCPACQANVRRQCGCGKTSQLMQCYLKLPVECDAVCEKLLNCELHACTTKCHDSKCQPCDKKVAQICHCLKQEREVLCTRETHDKHSFSCGKPCGKDLQCGNHKCKDCCHSGECRPCKQSPECVTTCPCGKLAIPLGTRNSCLDPIAVCAETCGKVLRCGKAAHPHHCTSKCHLGNCPPCNKQTAVKCRCGHMDQMIKCRQLSTRADDARCKKRCVKKRSCGKHKCNQECCIDVNHICPLPCNYTLSCGKHKCDLPCHRGNCPPCYRSSFDELYCECGTEVIYPPVACGTKRPLCKRPCTRSHPCEHPPQHNCHSAASCPPCMMFATKWCFGRHEQRKTIPCSQESFSCGLACNKPLPCGQHKCIKTCHEGPCVQTPTKVCKQSCTKLRASCGHKCMAPCHEGDCPDTPCKEAVEVQCECGNRKQKRTCHDLARDYSRIATASLASSMADMQRGNYLELNEILGPKAIKNNKILECSEECRLLERNRRLAVGLQTRTTEQPQRPTTRYSDFVRNFVKKDPSLVKSINDSLTNLVKLAKESKQKSRSHSFPIMNREKRQLVHELCEIFGVDSVAYDAEPNRNVVATAHKDRSWLPTASIIEIMQRESGQRRVPVPSNNAWGVKR